MNSGDAVYIFNMPQPRTELSKICSEVEHIAELEPEIIKLIAQDQEYHAKEEKKLRILDEQWKQTKLTPFPELELFQETKIETEKLI